MPTIKQLMADIDLRYRNPFSLDQKLVWYNEEMVEIYNIMDEDSLPYTFQTMEGENFYNFPPDYDITTIKVVNMEVNDQVFVEVPAIRNDDDQYVSESQYWYSIVNNMMYLNTPDVKVPDNKIVLVYCDNAPTAVTSADADNQVQLKYKYQEILKLGILKRICQARKDVPMANNYDMERQQRIDDNLWLTKMQESEWYPAADAGYRVGW